MELNEAVEKAIQAMKNAVSEGKYISQEGEEFIKNINDLIKDK